VVKKGLLFACLGFKLPPSAQRRQLKKPQAKALLTTGKLWLSSFVRLREGFCTPVILAARLPAFFA
jgi:hypothetical protein